MSFLDLFRAKTNSANLAKERLQIIIPHERTARSGPDYLPALRRDIMDVIKRYVSIQEDQISVQLEKSGTCSVLELNVTLPDSA